MKTKAAISINRERAVMRWVCETVGLPEEWYTNWKYKQGLSYIRKHFGHDEALSRVLEESGTFWAWWRYQWLLREERLQEDVLELGDCLRQSEIHHLMMATHDIGNLNRPPSSITLKKSLKQAMQW